MHHASVSVVATFALIGALPAYSGESPYNPGAPSNSEVLKKTPMSYYCTAQGNGESTWYVTGFEAAPGFGTPAYPTFEGNSSQAFTQYMYRTYGRNKVMYPHCTVGESKSLRPSWEQMQSEPRFKQTVHVNWRFDSSGAHAAG